MRLLIFSIIIALLSLTSCQVKSSGVAPATERIPEAIQTKAFYALSVKDIGVMETWYTDMFDMSVRVTAKRPPPDGPVVILENDEFIIEMMERTDSSDPLGYSEGYKEAYRIIGIYKIGFTTVDIETLADSLKSKGADFNHDIVSTGEPLSLRTFAIRDAEGNTVQIFGK